MPEKTNLRSTEFSKWIRQKLPEANTGFCVTDLDWIMWNWKTRRLVILEEKTRMGSIKTWYRKFLQDVMHPALKVYCADNDIDYRGIHLVQFENEDPEDGKIYLNGKEVTEEELIEFLSMENAQKTIEKDTEKETR